jgi:hypothetical protein
LLILKFDSATTIVSIVAGTIDALGDNGPATAAALSVPTDMAVDSSGNLYISDAATSRVRKVSAATGIITTVVGTGHEIGVSFGDGGPAIDAAFDAYSVNTSSQQPIAFDDSDNLYLLDDNGTIRRVDAQTGIISTIAGGGGLILSAADFYIDKDNLYFTPFNGGIQALDLVTGTISTRLNGRAGSEYLYLGGDAAGNIYFDGFGSSWISKLDAGADAATVIAGTSLCCLGGTSTGAQLGDGGAALGAALNPQGIKSDGSGNLYIADDGNFRVRYISAATGIISTIAGTNVSGCSGAQGPATSANFAAPSRIALGIHGEVYVADPTCQQVYKLTPVPAYWGNLDTATCQVVSGWAADQNRLNQSINVSIYDGSTLIATVPANLGRSDVGSYLGDNGMHGFSYTLPAALTGGAHSIHVEFETSSTEVGGSPKALTCGVSANPNYTGSIDSATCSGINGWVADRNRLNTSITVSLWDGATQIASTTANSSRPDVGAVIGDNGLHGFSLQLPSAYKNGAAHTLQVHYESTASEVVPPVTLTCGSTTNYAGNVDSATCTGINGWVADRNRPNTSITVSLWDGSTQIASTTANASRSDVGTYLSDNGLHGFSLQLPAAYKNGAAHSLQVHYESTASEVGSPFSLTCGSAANYAGNIDSATCTGISGWVADRNRPNTFITVSLWDGATQITSATANISRPDVGAYLSDNGLHGFSLQLPSAYKDGTAHTLQMHYESTASEVGQPFTLTCGSTNYLGFVDSASCSGINGWAADLNRLYNPITVSLWDGATQIASTTANSARPDVGAAIGDNGVHGFSLQLPSAYANGASHTLQVHFESSMTQLTGSPVTLKCAPPNYTGNVDILDCTTIAGWAADLNHLNTTLNVRIYDGSTLLATILSDESRPDVGAAIGDNGLHGFSIPTPASLKDGALHFIEMLPSINAVPLPGRQVLTCH